MAAGTTDESSVLAPDVDEHAEASPSAPGAPTPNLAKTASALATVRARSVGVTILAVLALLYTLFFARDFLLPIVIALLLNLLFSPVVRSLTRVGISAPVGAAVVVLGLLGLVSFGVYELSTPVERWAAEAPKTLANVETAVTMTIATRARTVVRCTRVASTRRLRRLPRPVPSSSENNVTVSEYTGCPSSRTNRCSTATSSSMNPAPSAAK